MPYFLDHSRPPGDPTLEGFLSPARFEITEFIRSVEYGDNWRVFSGNGKRKTEQCGKAHQCYVIHIFTSTGKCE
jgi:hypothetical protein